MNKLKVFLTTADTPDDLKDFDCFWCGQQIEKKYPDWFQELKKANKILLHYCCGATTTREGSFITLDYAMVNSHPGWFLYKDVTSAKTMDNRINLGIDRFYLDVSIPEFRKWAVSQLVFRSKKYTGIALDNVGLGMPAVWANQYPKSTYAGKTLEYTEAYIEYLRQLKQALNSVGKILVVNAGIDWRTWSDGDVWRRLMAVTDGMLYEAQAGTIVNSIAENKIIQQHHRDIVDAGKLDLWVVPESVREQYEAIAKPVSKAWRTFFGSNG